MSKLLNLNTPCIGICSTVYGDEICRGCKRTAQEVIDWNKYTDNEKQPVFLRLEALQVRIMLPKMTVLNAEQLRTHLDFYQIRYRASADPLCWAYHLLRVRANKIIDIKSCGLHINSGYSKYTLASFFDLINAEFLQAAIK